MGFALAREAARQGAVVTLVTGPVDLADPTGVEVERAGHRLQRLDRGLQLTIDGQGEGSTHLLQSPLRRPALETAEERDHEEGEDQHRHHGHDHQRDQLASERRGRFVEARGHGQCPQ